MPDCDQAMHLGNLISNNIFECADYDTGKFNSNSNYSMYSFDKC